MFSWKILIERNLKRFEIHFVENIQQCWYVYIDIYNTLVS